MLRGFISIMTEEEYQEFRAYDLLDSGEARELEMELDEVGKYLDPKLVFLFVREDLRRIYIWKGSVSPVRKRFISSRVAQAMQSEMTARGGRQCKIVSVDQGDELDEFLNAFNVESMPVTETLEDLYYVRNVDKERQELEEAAAAQSPGSQKTEEYTSPALKELTGSAKVSMDKIDEIAAEVATETPSPPVRRTVSPSGTPVASSIVSAPIVKGKASPRAPEPSKELEDEILSNIQEQEPPDGHKRLNIIIGSFLYGAIIQKKTVFGKEVESEKWERIDELPGGCIDLQEKYLRIYTNEAAGTISAVEILIPEGEKPDFNPKDIDEQQDLLEKILSNDLPEGKTRLNIIMGNQLYGPIVQKKTVFGKEVESETWEIIDELPAEVVDLGMKHLRIYADAKAGLITAIDILVKGDGGSSSTKTKSSQNKPAKKAAKRALKKIPSD